MILCFNTAYVDKKGDLISNHKKIASNYLKGWFSLDFIANLPIEILISWFSSGADFKGVYLKLFRVSKTVRLIRAFKLG